MYIFLYLKVCIFTSQISLFRPRRGGENSGLFFYTSDTRWRGVGPFFSQTFHKSLSSKPVVLPSFTTFLRQVFFLCSFAKDTNQAGSTHLMLYYSQLQQVSSVLYFVTYLVNVLHLGRQVIIIEQAFQFKFFQIQTYGTCVKIKFACARQGTPLTT